MTQTIAASYEYSLSVTEDAVDANGHVNNVMYVQWMQDAAMRHSDHRGFTLEEYHRLGATWVVHTHQIKYVRPAFLGEEIVVRTWIDSFSKFRCLRKSTFQRKKDQLLLAEAETEWVYVRIDTGRPLRIHDKVIKAFQQPQAG